MPSWYDQIRPKFVRNVALMYYTENGFDAFRMVPPVNSQQISGYLASYTKADWLRIGTVADYIRQGSVESAGDDYAVGKTAYTLDDIAFHKDVSKDDRNDYDNPFDPVRDAVKFVMHRLNRIVLYNLVSTFLTTSVWATDANRTSYKWDAVTSGVSDNDPVSYVVGTAAPLIESVTGFKPNRMIMSPDVFAALKTNTKITDKMTNTSDKVVTANLLARLFEVDELMVMNAVNSDGTDYLWTGACLLYYAPKVASKFAPSAGYNVLYKSSNQNIFTDMIPMPAKNHSLRIECSLKVKPVVMATDLGVYMYNLVS